MHGDCITGTGKPSTTMVCSKQTLNQLALLKLKSMNLPGGVLMESSNSWPFYSRGLKALLELQTSIKDIGHDLNHAVLPGARQGEVQTRDGRGIYIIVICIVSCRWQQCSHESVPLPQHRR